MTPYKTILAPAQDEFTEKRSRFIGAIAPVTTPEEAAAFIAARREEHYDARHTVYAYRLRDGFQKYSDDGEPQGTGGQPVLEVLKRNDLCDVCVAVTRYFGGILLGAGGLTRAYTNGAVIAVGAADVVTMRPCTLCTLAVDYSTYGSITRLLPDYECRTLDTVFAEDVVLSLQLPTEMTEPFSKAITELSAGKLSVEITGEVFGAI